MMLARAVKAGHSIGSIAHLSTDMLAKIFQAQQDSDDMPAKACQTLGILKEERHLDDALAATMVLDAASLERIMAEAAVTRSTPELLDHLLIPFMTRLGDLWQEGKLRVAQEHMASGIVRTFLGGLLRTCDSSDSVPRIIMATPVGQLHEIGAVMAAVTAASEGWSTIYLGPNLPAEEIAGAADRIGARAIALSIIYPPDDARLALELKRLRNYTSDDVSLFVGGRSAEKYRLTLDSIGASVIPDLPSFRNELERIRATSN